MAADSSPFVNFPSNSSESISFDRAAESYDATRGFPPGVAPQVAQALLQWLPERPSVLEIGIGTGRISLPLAQAGVSITGVDISPKMMQRLRENASSMGFAEQTMPSLVQADATRLPLAGKRFDAVLAVHLLHLIPAWQEALGEARRVLRSGGSFLIGRDDRAENDPYIRMRNYWREVVLRMWQAPDYRWSRYYNQIKESLIGQGAQFEEARAAEWLVTYTLEGVMQKLEQRAWSATWDVPEEIMQIALQETRQWAVEAFGDLSQPFTDTISFVWERYRWE